MYRQSLLLACVLLAIINGITSKMPEYFRPCKENSKELSKCLIENWEAARKFLITHDGDKRVHLNNIDTLNLPRVAISVTPQLPVILTNSTYTGLDTCKLRDISLQDNVLQMQGHCKELTTRGPYSMKGRILVLPIQGDGDMNMTLAGVDFKYTAKLQTEERKGKKYYYTDADSTRTTLKFVNVEHVSFYFGNLFGGDPLLGPQMNTLLNENWKEVLEETLPGLEYFNHAYVFNPLINAYLRRIPIDELFEKE